MSCRENPVAEARGVIPVDFHKRIFPFVSDAEHRGIGIRHQSQRARLVAGAVLHDHGDLFIHTRADVCGC